MTPFVIEEKVIAVMGDDVDTDIIFPTRYIAEFAEHEVAKHVFEDVDPGFVEKARVGGIIFAGRNFGCGSAREQAASGLKGAGVKLIIAKSFSRSFYRNGINVGLRLLELDNVKKGFAKENDSLRVNLSDGNVTNLSSGETVGFSPPDPFIIKIMKAGGIAKFFVLSDGYKNIDTVFAE